MDGFHTGVVSAVQSCTNGVVNVCHPTPDTFVSAPYPETHYISLYTTTLGQTTSALKQDSTKLDPAMHNAFRMTNGLEDENLHYSSTGRRRRKGAVL